MIFHCSKDIVQLDRSISEPCGTTEKVVIPQRRSLDESREPLGSTQERLGSIAESETVADPVDAARDMLASQEQMYPYLFTSLKNALHPLFTARYVRMSNIRCCGWREKAMKVISFLTNCITGENEAQLKLDLRHLPRMRSSQSFPMKTWYNTQYLCITRYHSCFSLPFAHILIYKALKYLDLRCW